MPPEIHWQAIALRLVLTIIAGGVLGMERSKTGHTAGLRTTLLVTLAASVAMIQMNLLIPTNGKPSDSYAVMDLMRLPLGILTGVGFIGAGAIVRKGDLVLGLTTAATMWFATVVGLCLGGGQIILGSTATLIGFGVLRGLHDMERDIERYRRGELRLTLAKTTFTFDDLRSLLQAAKVHVKSVSVKECRTDGHQQFSCEVRWPATTTTTAELPPVLRDLKEIPGLIELDWKSIETGPN
jgi:putative Mg2+ transporter-C (MgtC) family protein